MYTDIHTHILPNTDDGSNSISTSMEMLRMASANGVDLICLTPHFEHGQSITGKELSERYQTFCDQAKDSGIVLKLGSELLYSRELASDIEKGIALTMNGTRRILVEFYPDDSEVAILEGIRHLYNCGHIVILAHMERYHNINRRTVEKLLNMDVQLQMNSHYAKDLFRPVFGRKAWHKSLLKDGYISYIATDAHGINYRKPDLFADEIKRNVPKYADAMLSENALWLNE